MKRREFIALLCGAAALAFAPGAQQPRMPEIGWLNTVSPSLVPEWVSAFRKDT